MTTIFVFLLLQFSGFQDWKTFSYPENRSYPSVGIGSNGFLYALSDNKVYSSTNEGEAWDFVYALPDTLSGRFLKICPCEEGNIILWDNEPDVIFTGSGSPYTKPYWHSLVLSNEGIRSQRFILRDKVLDFNFTVHLPGTVSRINLPYDQLPDSGRYALSFDGGLTWKEENQPAEYGEAYFISNRTATWMFNNITLFTPIVAPQEWEAAPKLFKVQNGSASQVSLPTGLFRAIKQVFQYQDTLYATGPRVKATFRDSLDPDMVLRSTDLGSTWEIDSVMTRHFQVIPAGIPRWFSEKPVFVFQESLIVYNSMYGFYRFEGGRWDLILSRPFAAEVPAIVHNKAVYFFNSDMGHLAKPANVHNERNSNWHHSNSPVLDQNYPNPFNPSTVITFDLPSQSNIQLSVFDLNGRRVGLLFSGNKTAGKHSVIWNATKQSSGIYLLKLEAGNEVLTRKMTLVK
jgi:hypothetical protein